MVQKWTETVPCRSTSDPLLVQPRRVGELGGPRWTTPPQQVRGHPNKLGPPQQVGGHPNTLGLPQLVGVHVSALTADPRRPRWSKPRLPEPWADACDVSTAQYSVVMPALTAFNDGACVHRKRRCGDGMYRRLPEDLPGAPRVSATCSATTAPTTRPKGMVGAQVRARVGSIVKISSR